MSVGSVTLHCWQVGHMRMSLTLQLENSDTSDFHGFPLITNKRFRVFFDFLFFELEHVTSFDILKSALDFYPNFWNPCVTRPVSTTKTSVLSQSTSLNLQFFCPTLSSFSHFRATIKKGQKHSTTWMTFQKFVLRQSEHKKFFKVLQNSAIFSFVIV